MEDERLLPGRVVKASRLFDAYSALLTARQREVLELHYFQDLSLGEIAASWSTSRQAVHDVVRRALDRLERFEDKLGLVHAALATSAARDRIMELTAVAVQAIAAIDPKAGEVGTGRLQEARAALEQLEECMQEWWDRSV